MNSLGLFMNKAALELDRLDVSVIGRLAEAIARAIPADQIELIKKLCRI